MLPLFIEVANRCKVIMSSISRAVNEIRDANYLGGRSWRVSQKIFVGNFL